MPPTSLSTGLWAAAVLVVAAATAPSAPPPAARFGWHVDYAAARAEARKTGKPIFLVFRCEP